jgi:branched-chain amino acid transport system ATP-binding protein
MSALLELRDVTKRFGGVVANDAISLSVPEGAIVSLIGPNGWPAAGRGQPRGGQSRSQSGRRIFGSRVMAPVSDEGGMGHGVSVAELDRLAGPVPVLAVDHLDAGYGRMRVLRDLSLRLGKGQSICLVGPNGAGKSTVLHAIYGFARIFSGSVRLDGEDVTREKPSTKLKDSRLACVLQKESAFPDMTVEENL